MPDGLKYVIDSKTSYKKYLNYRLNDNISLDYSEKFSNERKVINAKERSETKFIEYNEKYYDYLLDSMRTEKDNLEKYEDSNFFDNEIKLLNDEFLTEYGYKTSNLQKFRIDILNGFFN